MGEEKDYNPISLFTYADVRYLYTIARSYLNAAVGLNSHKDNNLDLGLNLHPFHLLVTTAAELYLKLIIMCDVCLFHKNETLSDEAIRKTIMCELIKLGHNIKDALIKADIGNKFGIDKVEEIPNGKIMTFVNEYRIHFKNKNIISLKDSEAVRYGSLASKKDIAITHLGNREIVEFLNELDTFVQNKIVETQKIFKELDKKSLKRL